jgi:hypothetical protein
MANESVIEMNNVEPIGPCKHDVEMVNEVDERLAKILAVADILMCTESSGLLRDTMANIGWLLMDLTQEVKEIVNEKKEATA